jgi:short-subunit dehydrogenase
MMKGERLAVVGARNKIMVLGERFVPRKFVTRLSRKAQENR